MRDQMYIVSSARQYVSGNTCPRFWYYGENWLHFTQYFLFEHRLHADYHQRSPQTDSYLDGPRRFRTQSPLCVLVAFCADRTTCRHGLWCLLSVTSPLVITNFGLFARSADRSEMAERAQIIEQYKWREMIYAMMYRILYDELGDLIYIVQDRRLY